MADPNVKLEKLVEDGNLVLEILSSSSDNDGSPLRSIFCLKNSIAMKELEEVEDCFILDFDPFESINKLSLDDDTHKYDDDDVLDLSIVYERGQVACRDYPHSRHLCAKFPFDKTPHEKYCDQCYCYICDLMAPCKSWIGHCHATAHEMQWDSLRKAKKLVSAHETTSPSSQI